MDLLEHKLDFDNPLRMTQVFSQIYETACKPQSYRAAVDFLKLNCKSDNPLVSEMSAEVLVKLVQEGRIEEDLVLADFVISLSTRSSHSIIRVVASLLLLSQKKKFHSTKVIPRITLTQHPFVKVMKNNPAAQIDIFNEILQNWKTNLEDLSLVASLYEPVYLYTICHPGLNLDSSFIRENLWSLLLDLNEISTPIILKLLCWMQTERSETLHINSVLIIKLLESSVNVLNDTELEVIILKSISLLYQMIQHRQHCLYMLQALRKVCVKVKLLSTVDIALLILSEAVISCSPLHLVDLLELCTILIQKQEICRYSYCCLKFAILNWIGNPSSLTKNVEAQSLNILDMLALKRFKFVKSKSREDLSNKYLYILESDAKISLTMHLCLKIESTKNYLSWLAELEVAPVFFLRKIFFFLCGLCLDENLEMAIHEKLISLTSKCIETNYSLAFYSLISILYQLSDPHYSQIHFQLLKSLPKLACLKENGSRVAATIYALSAQPELSILATELMFLLWETDRNYYHHLEALISMTQPITVMEYMKSATTDASILKHLCDQCPHLYGKDIVPRLSKILNDCNNEKGAVPCALAIEGITALCKNGVIDLITTWANLFKKFSKEKRIPVIQRSIMEEGYTKADSGNLPKVTAEMIGQFYVENMDYVSAEIKNIKNRSLCSLIAAIPEMQYREDYEQLNEEILTHLWQYVANNVNEKVVTAAFDALSCFNFEVMSVYIPENYLDENSKLCLDQSKSISGSTWINLLSDHRFPKATKHFLIKLVSTEIENYLKYVYQVRGQNEPLNYNYLPNHSIVRALFTHLKKNMEEIYQWKNDYIQHRTYIDCLYILSRKYCRSLPPLDWCFLQELIHEPALRKNCLEIACHQVIISGSARRLVENFIVAYTSDPRDEEVSVLYENLNSLANSIQPETLKPFIKGSLDFGIQVFDNNPIVLEGIVRNLKSTLKNGEVQDINKQSIADVLKVVLPKVDLYSTISNLLLDVIADVPSSSQEEICRYSSSFEKEDFARKSKIRCFLASYSSCDLPLNWLSDIFEIGSRNNVRGAIFQSLLEVFKRRTNNNQNVLWFIEVLGQIQAKITNGCSETEIAYFCDILILATVSFSGCFAFMEEDDTKTEEGHCMSLARLFPQALAMLMSEDPWSSNKAQVLECLYYLNLEEAVRRDHQCIFGQALCALRHDMEFSKNSRWMKYLDCDIRLEVN